ncbi:hypothetical protein YC2023_066987 [Brassica napus]
MDNSEDATRYILNFEHTSTPVANNFCIQTLPEPLNLDKYIYFYQEIGEAYTIVFDGVNPAIIFENIKATLQKHELYGEVRVRAYREKYSTELFYYYNYAKIFLQKRVCKAEFTEVDNMLVDILTWGLYYLSIQHHQTCW